MWFYLLNATPRNLFQKNNKQLSSIQQRIVKDLERDGIAVTSLEELFPGENVLDSLTSYVDSHATQTQAYTKKKFLNDFWELVPELDFTNPFVRLSLRPEVLTIASAYMRMWVRLNYYHLATIQPKEGEAVQSQRWHRDNEDPKMCKMFVYINDVDETAGPFTYVRGSAVTNPNPYARLFPQKRPEGSYPSAQAVTSNVDSKDIATMTGVAGTVIFCDTTGLHRGGHATKRPRTMFTAFFTSKAWSDPKRYSYPNDIALSSEHLAPETRYALFLD